MTADYIHGMRTSKRKGKLHAQPGIPGRLMFYGFSNGPGQYVSERCLVQPLYSSEVGGGPPTCSRHSHVPPFSPLAKQTVAQKQSHAISACLQITGQRLELETITPGLASHSERNPPQFLAALARIAVAHVSQLGLSLEEPFVVLCRGQTAHAHLG